MELKDLRKNIRKSGDAERIHEIVNIIASQNFDDPKFADLHENYSALDAIFFYDKTNESMVNENDYKEFINNVLLKDFCRHYDIDFRGLSLKEKRDKEKSTLINFVRSINTDKGLVFDSSNFYGESYELNENMGLTINVSGENTFKVLNDIYQVLKKNYVVCSLQTQFKNELSKGYVCNIAIGVSPKFLNKALNALEELSPETISLIKKPGLLYASANSYIGYDYSYLSEGNISQSKKIKEVIEKSVHGTVDEIINKRPEDVVKIMNPELEQERTDGTNSLFTDLKIFGRAMTVDPTVQSILFRYLMHNNQEMNRCDYLFNNVRQEYAFNQMGLATDFEIYPFEDPALTAGEEINRLFNRQGQNTSEGTIVDSTSEQIESLPLESELNDRESENTRVEEEEISVSTPQIEFDSIELPAEKSESVEEELSVDSVIPQSLETTQALNIITEDTILASENATLVNPPVVENKVEPIQNDEIIIDDVITDQSILDSGKTSYANVFNDQSALEENILLVNPENNNPTEPIIITEGEDNIFPSTPIVIEEEPIKPASINDLTTSEIPPIKSEDNNGSSKAITEDEVNELTGILDGAIPVDQITPEEQAQMNEIFKEIDSAAPQIDAALSKMTSSNEQLTEDEIKNLTESSLPTETMTPEMEKYNGILEDINILTKTVPGTDFTLLYYLENSQINNRIDVNESYKIMADEIVSGRDLINSISQYVVSNGNVPLDRILDEYGAEIIEPKAKKEKSRLFKMFGKKS